MQFVKKGTPISEWLNSRAHEDGVVKGLADDNRLTTAAIYNYVASDRDIRVVGREIFEVKQLKGG